MSAKIAQCIDERQTAYLKCRLINDNIRAMLATVEIANVENNLKGLLVSLDAKKAFDSVEHSFIEECLSKFGCGRFIPIFRILYKELNSDILINGKIVKGFNILKGVKQGDSLSCILFIMCMESLLKNIENNPDIEQLQSVTVNGALPKAYAYADDVNCTIVDSDKSLQCLFKEYERLTSLSGLELNANKTEILCLGNPPGRIYKMNYMGAAHEICAQEKVKINGILFQRDTEQLRRSNLEVVNEKINSQLLKWSRRSLSILGKILILKTFGISQIIYVMQSMKLNESDFKILNSILYKFIWNRHFRAFKAPERIKRAIVNTPIKLGGLGMLDIAELDKSLKLKAVGRMFASEHPYIKILRGKLDMTDFFEPKIEVKIDSVINKGLEVLRDARGLVWEDQLMSSNREIIAAIREVNLKAIVTSVGIGSIPFFLLWRNGARKIKDLNVNTLGNIARYIPRKKLPKLELAVRVNLGPLSPDTLVSIVIRDRLKKIDQCSSKEIRDNLFLKTPITEFKIGISLSKVESETWCLRIAKLTSTRHKNVLLKIAHGDIYTKEKLNRFGLVDSSLCPRCDQIETLQHKLFGCIYASKIWLEFLKHSNSLTGENLINEPLINKIFGTFRTANLEYITIAAEIMQRILQLKDDQTFLIRPNKFIQYSIRSVAKKEKERKIKEKLYSLLDD